MTHTELTHITSHFDIQGQVTDIKPLGNGLINTTYRVTTDTPGHPGYVLQCINHHIFTDVEGLQRNIDHVTRHLRTKLQAANATDIDRRVLQFIPNRTDSRTYIQLDGPQYWRMMRFIPDAQTVDTISPHYAYTAGKAFGQFQNDLSDLNPSLLSESIPDFHNMEYRLTQLQQAIHQDKAARATEVRNIIDQLLERAPQMCAAQQYHRQGLLPKRICHCDTKVNNMMFDTQGNVLCVIDLDTVMPSFIFSDYGDFLRTAASTQPEDSDRYSDVAFRMDIFQAFTQGYLSSAASFLTPLEKEMLPFAAALFPYMQAVRFFTDYLNGDTYYKTTYPTHNLVRTHNQLALLHSIDSHQDQMTQFIQAL